MGNTGDPLIDRWEKAIATGGELDLSEAFTPDAYEQIVTKIRTAKEQRKPHVR